jgi:hypothetical protein
MNTPDGIIAAGVEANLLSKMSASNVAIDGGQRY